MAKASKAREPEVLDALEQDIQLVRDDSTIVEKFIGGVKAFFVTAKALEQQAKATLAEAEKLQPAKTMADDEKLQLFIKGAKADGKNITDLWTITARVHAFHKRLVSLRQRAELPNERAVQIATDLHNDYVAAEKRRVDAINEQRRKDAEAKAAADRAAELAAAEQKALDAEAASTDLSEREQRFVADYFRESSGSPGVDPMIAARRAGYAQPRQAAEKLLKSAKILKALEGMRTAAAIREQAAAVKEQPLDVQHREVTANVSRAGGSDRTTKSMEIFDERLFIEAIVGGRHGIPLDLLTVLPAKGNEYARSLGEMINRWPGVRLKKSTSLV